MEQSSEYREQLLESYKQAVRPLLPYLPWLEQSAGKRASSIYSGQDIGVNSVSFPVYDGTLRKKYGDVYAAELTGGNARRFLK